MTKRKAVTNSLKYNIFYKSISLLSITVSLLIWFLISKLTTLDEIFLPSPIKVFEKFISDITNLQTLNYIFVTLVESAFGSIIGAFIGVALALTVYKSVIADKAIHPFIAMSQSIPAIALAPVLVLWIGYGLISIIILCTLIVFFPIFISTLTGFKTIDKEVIEAAKLDGATGIKLIAEIEFPLAIPNFLSGLRNGFTLSITGAIVGEMVMGGNGLGTLLTVYRNNLDIVGMFSTIIILCVLSLLIYQLLLFFERKSKIMLSLIP